MEISALHEGKLAQSTALWNDSFFISYIPPENMWIFQRQTGIHRHADIHTHAHTHTAAGSGESGDNLWNI